MGHFFGSTIILQEIKSGFGETVTEEGFEFRERMIKNICQFHNVKASLLNGDTGTFLLSH